MAGPKRTYDTALERANRRVTELEVERGKLEG